MLRCILTITLGCLVACGGGERSAVEADLGVPPTDAESSDTAVDGRVDPLDAGVAADAADAAGDGGADAARPGCNTRYLPSTTTGQLGNPALLEQSGLAASRLVDDRFWTHNDSGDDAFVYGIGADGRDLGRVELRGIDADDFEDIAAADCPDGTAGCLWLADIGDNAEGRDNIRIYVFPEPALGVGAVDVPWTFRFEYAGGPRDAEALMVAADGRRLWIVDKTDDGPTSVFEGAAPWPDETGRLTRIATFAAPGPPIPMGNLVTAADLHPEGARLALRVYGGVYEYHLPQPGNLSAMGDIEPRLVTLGPLSERQGEAIAYSRDGRDLYSVSESVTMDPGESVHIYRCAE